MAPALVERRLATLERLFDLDLAAGRYDVLELRALTVKYPVQERFWAQLMIALHRSGRQAEAFTAYSDIRRRLVDELGVEPGTELRRAHKSVLAGAEEETVGWPVHCQLPLDVNDFTGRHDELAGLLDAVNHRPVVTISGPPGIGKSALAIHAAHRLAANYPDGQWFVRLADASPNRRPAADLLVELLRTAGVAPQGIPADLEQRAALLRSRLAERKVLLVLDDAGSVDQVAPLLPGRRGSTVIVTSRSDLAGLSVL
ncbi:BTAD domain-containing putative transcriptional regulator [Actinocrispum sp. NPDC049592]|uniref:BTAD domain-containing putative transcriptional regulator n=1 Tax=Actinocrispum sp. NPDC049592 TaxID=3154835 RepID=UPI00342D6662